MKKLIEGIVEFRNERRDRYKDLFAKLATGQKPNTLFIACSDSRVVPNTFASTNPGDLFVLRNVGNLVAPCDTNGISISDESEAAAIEFSVLNLKIKDIVVCGHSECGAMQALYSGREKISMPNLKNWLRHADKAKAKLSYNQSLNRHLTPHNQLSQLNVLLQLEHIMTYPSVKERVLSGSLQLHGWWFDIANVDVFHFDNVQNNFILIDEKSAKLILAKLLN